MSLDSRPLVEPTSGESECGAGVDDVGRAGATKPHLTALRALPP